MLFFPPQHGGMSEKGPVQREMEGLLSAAFPDADFTLSNDSVQHHGHAGDDGSGESHFSLTIEWAGFAGQNRVARQRMVNRALGDLPGQRVHALAIKALAPGE
jgi:BolA protein